MGCVLSQSHFLSKIYHLTGGLSAVKMSCFNQQLNDFLNIGVDCNRLPNNHFSCSNFLLQCDLFHSSAFLSN